MDAEYISLSQAMRDVLLFVSIMKEIEFVLNLKGDTLAVLYSLFENPVTVHEDNQHAIALVVALQIQPHTKHIVVKYHHFQISVANGDVEIQHIDTK